MTQKLLVALCFIVVAFTQCRTNNKNNLISDNQLPAQSFTIDLGKDTVIHTAKGALINIPKGSLQADGATSVNIEVKEAYTLADMILGGLTTKAGKAFLSSGGMIFINPTGNGVKIIQPITVSIPTNYRQNGMQLYKGERKNDGTLDWTDPQPLPLPETLAVGKSLFLNNCASCHNPVKDATGPALAFLDKRRDWDWLIHFIHNPSQMVANDPLAKCDFDHYNKTVMTSFPTLSDEDIHRIFDYVDYQAGNIPSGTNPDFKKSFDSCLVYQRAKQQLVENRDSLIIDNGPQVEISAVSPLSVAPENGPGSKPENMVHPAENKAIYYQFKIQVFGWYNVDVLFRDLQGFVNSTLTVATVGEYREDINIYLVIPAYKVFVPGGPVAGKTDEYAFFTDDGQTPLPQNAKAYIIAMGDYKGQVWFGKTEFITSLQQTPQLQLSAMTKEQMNMAVKKLGISDIDIKATDTKNANQIRKIDAKLSELEKLKPKGCDCNCLTPASDSTAVR